MTFNSNASFIYNIKEPSWRSQKQTSTDLLQHNKRNSVPLGSCLPQIIPAARQGQEEEGEEEDPSIPQSHARYDETVTNQVILSLQNPQVSMHRDLGSSLTWEH